MDLQDADGGPEEVAKSTSAESTAGIKCSGVTVPNPLSKNQLKKQKKMAQYEKAKKERRLRERERQKERRRKAVQLGVPARVGPSRKELKRRQMIAQKDASPLRIAIDLDCDDLMSERDVAKCVKQCLRIYTINRRSIRPVQLHFTGIKTGGNIHAALKKNDGWENWFLNYHFDEPHTRVFPTRQIVYLTCESETTLERLVPEDVYIIGGLVDHNHHKGLCHKRAVEAGLRTARLPLGEYVNMKTRSVLSTFHVFEILVRLGEGKSWTEAILQTIPPRKGARAKDVMRETPTVDDKIGNNVNHLENITEVTATEVQDVF